MADPNIIADRRDFDLGWWPFEGKFIVVVMFGRRKTICKIKQFIPQIKGRAGGCPMRRMVLPTDLHTFAK